MAKLRIWISDTDRTLDFDVSEVMVGRDPTFDVVIEGASAHIVSTRHARFFHSDDAWWVEDTGSSNGTFVGANHLSPNLPVKLSVGDTIRLGHEGVTIRLEKSFAPVAVTMLEPAALGDDDATQKMEGIADVVPPRQPRGPGIRGEFEELRSGKRFVISGTRVRLGRGKECELRPVEAGDTSVSRVHAEILLKADGRCVITDAKSRNGTLLNGDLIKGERELTQNDVVTLGEGGPHLRLASLELPVTAARKVEPEPTPARSKPPEVPPAVALPVALHASPPRRSFGGQGATQYIKGLVADAERRSTKRSKALSGAIVVIAAVALGVGYWYTENRVASAIEGQQTAIDQQRQEMLAQRSASDSVTAASAAEMERLRSQLGDAQLGSAPTGMLDSLRAELAAASRRTEDLEASFRRAQVSLAQQVAAGDSIRREAEVNLRRLRTEFSSANSAGTNSSTGVSQAQLDSLRSAIVGAETRVTEMSGRIRAVQGVGLAAIAQANQGAVGMVTAFQGGGLFDGSGFMLTESGIFVTNRHVAQPGGRRADSLFIIMADSRRMIPAEVVRVSPPSGPDVAVLQVRNYQGPVIARVDWTGTRVAQGEPAALIGLPAGAALAINRQTGTVQTSMSAGIFSKVEEDRIQFDGFTIGGSSGSPVFNGDGEVVAIHYAGLEDVAGLGFAVPITKLIAFLPAAAKRELNIP